MAVVSALPADQTVSPTYFTFSATALGYHPLSPMHSEVYNLKVVLMSPWPIHPTITILQHH